jgi:hypothetical protein
MATRNYSAVVMNPLWGLVSEIPFVHGKTSDVSTDIYLWPNDFVLRHSLCGDIRALSFEKKAIVYDSCHNPRPSTMPRAQHSSVSTHNIGLRILQSAGTALSTLLGSTE